MQLSKFIDRSPIRFFGSFTEKNYKDFLKDFYLCIDKEEKQINILITSYGGDVQILLAMLSFLKSFKNKGYTINTYASGIAQSCGFLLFMMGDNRYADSHVEFMHHQVWSTLYVANSTEVEKTKKELDKAKKTIEKYVKIPMTVTEQKTFARGEDVFWDFRSAKKRGILT